MADLITDVGKQLILDRTYNDDGDTSLTAPSLFKVGQDQTTILNTTTGLTHPIPISGTDLIDDCEATTGWADSAEMTLSVNSTTFKIGSGALNLTKDGSGNANANTEKTTNSIDFTDQEFAVWIYVSDTPALDKLAITDCFEVRFGSDSSNYYIWTKDKSDFSVLWNNIDGLFVSTADSTVGTPDLLNMDYTRIQLTADAAGTTWSDGDFIMDDIKAIAPDNYTKAFTTLIIDNLNLEVETRLNLSSAEANGYLLSGLGIVNTDTSEVLFSADDFLEESKSNSDEFVFIVKDRFT